MAPSKSVCRINIELSMYVMGLPQQFHAKKIVFDSIFYETLLMLDQYFCPYSTF